MYMVSIKINKSNFQLYWQHFIIDWIHPPPVKMVNYGKLLEKKTWSEEIIADLPRTPTYQMVFGVFNC